MKVDIDMENDYVVRQYMNTLPATGRDSTRAPCYSLDASRTESRRTRTQKASDEKGIHKSRVTCWESREKSLRT